MLSITPDEAIKFSLPPGWLMADILKQTLQHLGLSWQSNHNKNTQIEIYLSE